MDVETPDVVRVALQSGGPAILLGLHFGAIELPTVFMAHHLGRPVTAPMETVSDPAVARWFRESRSRVGANLVPVVNARRALLDALRRGDSVGLVNDRDLTGGGLLVPFFGAPAPIPPGAALLAIETGVPMYVAACRRTSGGRYAGKLVHVPAPVEGTRRERMTELTARIAATFETIIADAPEQWWGAFHPIWPDLVVAETGGAGRGMTDEPPVRQGRADLHIHSLASDGTSSVAEILDHVAAQGFLDVVAITDHERIDAALAARHMAEDRGLPFAVVVGEEITTRGGHLLGLFLERPIPALKSLRWSIEAVHDQGGLAVPAHPLVPYPLCAQGPMLRRLLAADDPAARPDAIETFNPTALGRYRHGAVVTFAEKHGLPQLGNSDAHVASAIGAGWTAFPGRTPEDLLAAPGRGRDAPPRRLPRVAGAALRVRACSCASTSATCGPAWPAASAATAPGRDHGYPGGTQRPPRYDPPRREDAEA